MIRVSYEAIEGAAQKLARVSGELGCGTPIAEISGAGDDTPAAGALDACARAWTHTLQLHSRQASAMQGALKAAGECYLLAEQSTANAFQRALSAADAP